MKKKLFFLFILLCSFVNAQTNTWTEITSTKRNESVKIIKPILPEKFRVFEFNYDEFVKQLVNVPQRDAFTGVSNVVIAIPHPNGTIAQYRIVEASTFEPELQAKFPEIRSFAGQGIDDPSNVLRFSISPYNGVSAIIRSSSEETTFVIDPYTSDYKNFIVYDKKFSGANSDFKCTTDDISIKEFGPTIKTSESLNLKNADDSILRRYRLAMSCTGEYAAFHGGTIAKVNAAFNATMTRVNGIFEMDFNTTMVIVATNNNVIYLNAGTDPYGATDANYNSEAQSTITAQIGAANYDIGHLVSAIGNNGNAGCIGCICGTGSSTAKGSGYTTSTSPIGDNFDIDFVAHEMGHQYGGNHTFSFSAENNAVNMEPGSGVAIMGYAGITGATDVAPHSIAIFHAASIQQITDNIKTKTCQTNIPITNAVPVPSAPATKTLPIGTAFKLTGTATDANVTDVLSYCWEQYDDATTVGAAASYPSGTKDNGANFRSYMPVNNGTRYFPRIVDHLKNGVAGNQWEIVPTIDRTLNFRMTVRDNKLGGGNNESVNTAVTFVANRGPFTVTSQNATGINYAQNSTQTVNWSVNNTNLMTGATNVNIKLSTDGGLTYPTMLVANTANDGSQTVTIPNVFAPYCRILIEPTANDFYAINTVDFAIGYNVSTSVVCNQYNYAPALAIPDNNTAVGFNVAIPNTGIISDINVLNLNLTHTYVKDITLGLNHPDGTQVLYIAAVCSNQDGFNNTDLDSQAPTIIACPNGSNSIIDSGTYKPSNTFDTFNGKPANGNWTFFAIDGQTSDVGTLNSLTLEVCTPVTTITETPIACGTITSTWNGSTWSNGVPLKNVAAIFAGNYTSTADLEACSVTVNTGVNVTFVSGHTLIVGGSVTVNGTGTLTINNNAALRQIDGSAVNTGNIIVKRNSTGMVRLDYTAWSSPVSGQQLQAFSPNTLANRFYQYLYTGTTTATAYQSVTATTNFVSGKGYMIRSANDWPTTSTVFNGQFAGVPTNGNVSQTVGIGYNLLGNPYASPISANTFLGANTSISTLYFWTHTVPASGGVYPVNNYASYTTLGGTAAAAGGAIPNGTIQTGQGFFVRATAAGNANFTNAQRVNASVSTQFYKSTENISTENETEKHRIWLNLNDASNNYNQILVGYINGATNGVDLAIDGEVLDKEKTMLYNVINDSEYVIQGKGLPFVTTDEIALGLKATTAGTYNISLENVDGLFINQDVFVKDNMTNAVHNIKQTPYVFTTTDGIFNNRFKIVFANTTVLSNETFVSDNSVVVFTQNEELKINASQEMVTVEVFDVLGRNIYNNKNVNDKMLNISSIANRNQALLVKITFTTGQSITKKVIK